MRKGVWATVIISLAIALVAALSLLFYTHPSIHRIPSEPGSQSSVIFYAIGDQGTGGIPQWAVSRAMEKQAEKDGSVDFVVLLGDNFYTGHELTLDSPEWKSMFENVYSGTFLSTTPFYAVLGNHDYLHAPRKMTADCPEHASQCHALLDPSVQVEYSRRHLGSNRWRMPAKYYSVDFGKISERPLLRIVFLDTNLKREDLLKEADFVRRQFPSTANSPVWKIVAGHHPVRNYGKHHGEGKETSDILLAAMSEAEVDLYLAGHDHNQQLIARSGEPVYIIDGAGGGGTYKITSHPPDLRFSYEGHGFVSIRLDAANMKLDFYDAAANTTATYRMARSCTSGQASCLQAVSK